MKKSITNEIFAQNLKVLMEKFGATQEMISGDLGIAQSAISNYLNGRVPRADILIELANYFGVAATDLLSPDTKELTAKTTGLFSVEAAMLLTDLKDDISRAEKNLRNAENELKEAKTSLGVAKLCAARLESIRKLNVKRTGEKG